MGVMIRLHIHVLFFAISNNVWSSYVSMFLMGVDVLFSQVVKVSGVSLWALFREKKEKPRN